MSVSEEVPIVVMIYTDEEYVSLTLRECFLKRSVEEELRLACEFESTCLKRGKYKNHSIFNLRCKKMGSSRKHLEYGWTLSAVWREQL